MSAAVADLDELDGVAETVASKREFGGKNFPGLEDGKHTFQILLGELKEFAAGITYKFKLGVNVGTDLVEGEKVYWLKGKNGIGDQERKNLNDLKADLAALGCDVDNWTAAHSRPFTKELKRASSALVGVKFDGAKKTTESKTGTVYVNIYVNARTKDDGFPEVIDAAVIEKANEADKFF